ncbi:MAG TPA: hypothetical protein VFE42_20705 [Chloroflexota bacterium]|nr:hypothetical protein [Chloroflexota bacterium]HZS89899.1 hypothetical protein [Chloroflexota bacterium]
MSAEIRTTARPADWVLSQTSAAGNANSVTQQAPGTGLQLVVTDLSVSWSGGAPAAGATVVIQDAGATIWAQYIGQAGATQGSNDYDFAAPLMLGINHALTVTVAAAGAGVTTTVNVSGYTRNSASH